MEYRINQDLADKLGLDDKTRECLYITGNELFNILENPDEHGAPKDVTRLIEEFEFKLQGLWGFDQDWRYHTHWKYVKGCVCPKMDNEDPMYFGRRIINEQCPFHALN